MSSKNFIKAIPLSSVASTDLTGDFQVLSPAIGAPCFLLKIVNNSDEDVFVSYDTNPDVTSKIANDYVPKGNTKEIYPPILPNGDKALWSSSTPVFILGAAGTTGSIYLAGYYSAGGI